MCTPDEMSKPGSLIIQMKGLLEHGRVELMDRSWRFGTFCLVYQNNVVQNYTFNQFSKSFSLSFFNGNTKVNIKNDWFCSPASLSQS